MAPVEPALANPSMPPYARIGFGLEGFGGVVAHLYHLGSVDYRETLGGATFGCDLSRDLRLVAEKNDAALLADRVESHYGAFYDRFGSEIAAHGVDTNL